MVFINGMVKNMKVIGSKVNNMVMDILLILKDLKKKVFGIWENVLHGQMNNLINNKFIF